MSLEALVGLVDELVAAGPEAVSGGADLVVLVQQLGRLESLTAEAARAFELSGEWSLDGSRNATSWLASHGRLPRRQARGHARLGRALAVLSAFQKAAAEGRVGPEHVRAVDRVRRPSTEAAVLRDEELLVEMAEQLRFDDFTRALAYWEQQADPDGTQAAADRAVERRNLSLAQSIDDIWFGQFCLDPINGSIVAKELDRIADELFEQDRAAAVERLGRDPKDMELGRSRAQRRADALVEMAARSAKVGRVGIRSAPLFTVLVGYETLHGRICELSNGTVVPPDSLLRWMEAAEFERVVFAPGKRIEVSRTSRFFTGATRRAIEVRDRRCMHPTCDVRVDRCQADHIVPFTKGGWTTQENGRLLCGFHNLLRVNHPWDEPLPAAGPVAFVENDDGEIEDLTDETVSAMELVWLAAVEQLAEPGPTSPRGP